MVFGTPFQLGISLLKYTSAFELVSGCSATEIETIIPTFYRQVLGNAYAMKNERATVPESQVQTG